MRNFIFGGNTGRTYRDLYKQALSEPEPQIGQINNLGDGILSASHSIANMIRQKKYEELAKQEQEQENKGVADFNTQFSSIFNDMSNPQEPVVNSDGGYASQQILQEVLPPVNEQNPNIQKSESAIKDAILRRFNPDVKKAIQTASNTHGVPIETMGAIAELESSGNPNAKNANSSAGGLYQFIDDTAKQYGLDNKFDVNKNADAGARFTRDNALIFEQKMGRKPTAGESYMMHQQGANGALKILSNPEALAVDTVGVNAIRLNGGNDKMTNAEFAKKWTNKADSLVGVTPDNIQNIITQKQEIQPFLEQGVTSQQPQAQQVAQQQPNIKLEQLVQAYSNPYASEGQRAILQQILQQKLQEIMPNEMQNIEIQNAKLEQQYKQQESDRKERETNGRLNMYGARAKSYETQAQNTNAGTWSNPQEVFDPQTGQRVLVQQNNKTGETRPLQDYTPVKPISKGAQEYQKEAGSKLLTLDEATQFYENSKDQREYVKKILEKKLPLIPEGSLSYLGSLIRKKVTGQSDALDAESEANALLKDMTLDKLKTTFGGNPTEGERKELAMTIIDTTASAKARIDALKRYYKLSELDYKTNKKQAEFYKQQIGTAPMPLQQPLAQPAQQPTASRYRF